LQTPVCLQFEQPVIYAPLILAVKQLFGLIFNYGDDNFTEEPLAFEQKRGRFTWLERCADKLLFTFIID
jgi:hypothetical protein